MGSQLLGRQRRAVEPDLAAGQRPHAGERFEQLRLAVAGHPGDAEDFAGAQRERDIVEPRDAAIVLHRQTARLQDDRAGMRLALVDLEDHLAADHRVGELRRRGRDVSKVATISPRRITETRSVSAMISRSLWVMKMIVLFCDFSTRSISNS